MKYIIEMDIYDYKNVIVDNTFIKELIDNFSWYSDRPPIIDSLKPIRILIKVMKLGPYGRNIIKIRPKLYEI